MKTADRKLVYKTAVDYNHIKIIWHSRQGIQKWKYKEKEPDRIAN